mmetsp:Transcript_28192/g.42681  ORF Transcript_28192/g.42681 Transcript_28192/m.42681 type:complete len:186 (+) Transcript_28192:430-987(+)
MPSTAKSPNGNNFTLQRPSAAHPDDRGQYFYGQEGGPSVGDLDPHMPNHYHMEGHRQEQPPHMISSGRKKRENYQTFNEDDPDVYMPRADYHHEGRPHQMNEPSQSPYQEQPSGTEEPDLGEGEGEDVYGGEDIGDTSQISPTNQTSPNGNQGYGEDDERSEELKTDNLRNFMDQAQPGAGYGSS